MKAQILNFLSIQKATFYKWLEDRAPRMAAALAFYTLFSVAPILIIAVAIAGLVFGHDAAQGRIVEQLEGLVGNDGAHAIQELIDNSRRPSSGILASVVGIATLLLGATAVFGELQDALNTIWQVKAKETASWRDYLKTRFVSFTIVVGIGFLLLVSLVLSAAISAMTNWFGSLFPVLTPVLHLVDFLVSFAVLLLLFALMFRYVPDAEIAWKDVWLGAAMTSLMFALGKLAIGFYLGHSGVTSTYGAAGSLVVLLLWVYYSAQIVLYGAGFTHVYACRHQVSVKPSAIGSTAKSAFPPGRYRPPRRPFGARKTPVRRNEVSGEP